MPQGLTAFLILKPITAWLLRMGWSRQPFTAQENTVVQTFAMAMVTSLWILGFGSYLQVLVSPPLPLLASTCRFPPTLLLPAGTALAPALLGLQLLSVAVICCPSQNLRIASGSPTSGSTCCLQAMDYQSYLNAGGLSTPGNFPQDTLNPCVSSNCLLCMISIFCISLKLRLVLLTNIAWLNFLFMRLEKRSGLRLLQWR